MKLTIRCVLVQLGVFHGFSCVASANRKLQIVESCLRGMHASAISLVLRAVYRLFRTVYLDADVQQGSSLDEGSGWIVIIATVFVGGLHFSLSPSLAIPVGGVTGIIWYAVASG